MANYQFILNYAKEAGKYVISGMTGVGVTLAALLAWTGAEDLDAIKTAVQQTVEQANALTDELSSSYLVEINKANAEIEDYQVALEQANKNILALKTEYNKMADMLTEAEANDIIAKANEEIGKANEQVAETKEQVDSTLSSSLANTYKNKDGILQEYVKTFAELKRQYEQGLISEEDYIALTGGVDITSSSANTGNEIKVVELPKDLQKQPTEQPTEEPTEQPQN